MNGPERYCGGLPLRQILSIVIGPHRVVRLDCWCMIGLNGSVVDAAHAPPQLPPRHPCGMSFLLTASRCAFSGGGPDGERPLGGRGIGA